MYFQTGKLEETEKEVMEFSCPSPIAACLMQLSHPATSEFYPFILNW